MANLTTMSCSRRATVDATLYRNGFDKQFEAVIELIPTDKRTIWFNTMLTMTRNEVSNCLYFLRKMWDKSEETTDTAFPDVKIFGANLEQSIDNMFAAFGWFTDGSDRYRCEFFIYFYEQYMNN